MGHGDRPSDAAGQLRRDRSRAGSCCDKRSSRDRVRYDDYEEEQQEEEQEERQEEEDWLLLLDMYKQVRVRSPLSLAAGGTREMGLRLALASVARQRNLAAFAVIVFAKISKWTTATFG